MTRTKRYPGPIISVFGRPLNIIVDGQTFSDRQRSHKKIVVCFIVVAIFCAYTAMVQVSMVTSSVRVATEARRNSPFVLSRGDDVNIRGFEGHSNTMPVRWSPDKDLRMHNDSDKVAKNLAEEIRILCWVMTGPLTINDKAVHVKKTWGQRCTKLLFMSSEAEPSLPAIGLNTSEGRDHLTEKTMKAFLYIYKHHFKDADWFLKADDDTYVIMENLRYFLSDEDPELPFYFGHKFHLYLEQGYNSGGAGYVLSKTALQRFALLHRGFCEEDGAYEDLKFGTCMEILGIRTRDTRDSLGRERFLCFVPEMHMINNFPLWYYEYHKNESDTALTSISDYTISFHYVRPSQMYFLEFYVYHLRPHGIRFGEQALNRHDANGT